jgi:PAS domain S-box-containing protein
LIRLARANSEQAGGAIDGALRDIGEYFGLDQAAIFLLVNEGRALAEDSAWHAPETSPYFGLPLALNVDELPWLISESRAGRVVQVPQVDRLAGEARAERTLLQQCGLRSFIAVPMFVNETLIGIIALCALRSEATWRGAELNLLKLPAEAIANALYRKQIDQAMRHLALGTAAVSWDALFQTLARDLASALKADSVLLAERIGDKARVLALWVDGESREPLDYPWTSSACGTLEPGQSASFQPCSLGRVLQSEDEAATEPLRCLTLPATDGAGQPIGHICVRGVAIYTEAGTQVILRAFAARLAAELARKRTESDLHVQTAALEATASAVVITEPDGTIWWANPAFFQLTGYPSSDVLGRNMSILNSGRQAPEFYQQLWRTITSGQIWRGELVNRRKDGSLYHEGMAITPVRDRSGKIVNFIALKRDISDLKRAEREQEQLQRRLQQTDKMQALGLMVGGIAHDFNNILASVMGYADLARLRFGGKPGGKLRDYLDEIYRAGERARDLVAQMLVFSRGGTSEPRPLLLEPLVKELVKMLQSTLASNIAVTIQSQPGLSAVMLDPVQLNQIVLNLCLNARDAIRGNGAISVRLQHVEVADQFCASCREAVQGDFVELMVADTGVGIEPNAMDHMFDPFFTTKEVGKGTGMGLPVVHGIVHRCGGHVAAETSPGLGSAFRVWLPPVVTEQTTPEPSVERFEDASRVIGGHILLVDDESSVLNYLTDVLTGAGCRVTATLDSREALARFTEDPSGFDLLVTDQTMPGITGDALIAAVSRLRPDIPVVLCTGHSETIDEDEARDLGIGAFLLKPVHTGLLLDTLERLLASRSIAQAGSPPRGA